MQSGGADVDTVSFPAIWVQFPSVSFLTTIYAISVICFTPLLSRIKFCDISPQSSADGEPGGIFPASHIGTTSFPNEVSIYHELH